MTVVAPGGFDFDRLPGRNSGDPFATAGRGESSVRQITIEPAPTRSPHLHPHSEEVIYVVEGRGRVWIDGVFHDVGPGSWYRIPAMVPHATTALPGESLTLACFFPHPELADNIEELDTVIDLTEEET